MLVFSRLVLGFLNVLALTFSIFQIIFAIVESQSSSTYKNCNKKSAWMILCLSVFLLMMSLIGLMASCLRSRVLQTIYLVVAVVATLVAVAITVFTFAALPNSSANVTRQKAVDKNWITEFSPFLRKSLVNDEDWDVIRNCLIDIELCRRFKKRSPNLQRDNRDEDFLQLGCCVPPNRCGFVQQNGTYKDIPKPGAAALDAECRNWANNLNGECYECDSCKAGYLAQFQADWRADGGIFIGIVVALVIVTFVTCYILRKQTTIKDQLEYKHVKISRWTQNKDHSIGEFSISCPEEVHPQGIAMEPFAREDQEKSPRILEGKEKIIMI